MREHLGFLKVSSFVVKIAAWFSLFLGLSGVIAVALGKIPKEQLRIMLVALGLYLFSFFFLYLIAKMADLLAKIINEIKKE